MTRILFHNSVTPDSDPGSHACTQGIPARGWNDGSLSSTQLQLDAAFSSFSTQATDSVSLASMTLASLAGKFAFAGTRVVIPAFFSHMASLGTEAATFSLVQGGNFSSHFVNFATFRLMGSAFHAHNPLLQHASQSFAMFAGHQVAAGLNLEERSHESIAQQLFHASLSTLQIQVGSVLAGIVSGHRIHTLERNLGNHSLAYQPPRFDTPRSLPVFASETSLAGRFFNEHETSLRTRIEACVQEYRPEYAGNADAIENFYDMEKAFCESICGRLEHVSMQHGLGEKPVMLFDVDTTLCEKYQDPAPGSGKVSFFDKSAGQDVIRPSAALLFAFLKAQFPGIRFGIATSRSANWVEAEEHWFRQKGWQEVEGFFERDLLFTGSESIENTYEGSPCPPDVIFPWDEARLERFYREDFEALVDNYLAHAEALHEAIQQRQQRDRRGRSPESFDLEKRRVRLLNNLNLQEDLDNLRKIPPGNFLLAFTEEFNRQEGAQEYERSENPEIQFQGPHPGLRQELLALAQHFYQLTERRRQNQNYFHSLAESFSNAYFSRSGVVAFYFTKFAAGKILLDQKRATSCLVVDAGVPRGFFDLLAASLPTGPDPYSLLGITQHQHKLWLMNCGQNGAFSFTSLYIE